MTTYEEFLARKHAAVEPLGHAVTVDDVNPMLHEWQREIVAWAVARGRAAVWADTGLGKTFMQVEWARLSGDTVLIVAPLVVCAQTAREAARLGVTATYVRDGIPGPGVWITNYEMVEHFDPDDLDAVVLDEASILKQSDGKTRTRLIRHFAGVPKRLACTATPAPNDVEELTNQAEFLGVSTRTNMLAAYFVHDDTGWRLKGHARRPMFRWMTSWAVALRRPSDLGYSDDGYDLPGLEVISHLLDVDAIPEGQLFATDLGGVGGRAAVRRATLDARCQEVVRLVNESHGLAEVGSRATSASGSSATTQDSYGERPTTSLEPWIIWVGLNDEQEYLARAFGDRCFSVTGNQSPEEKAEQLLRWADGERPILVTKPAIAGFGMNFQHCARMAFVGLSDSYEAYYQAIRRCYRYGQTRVVHAHIVLSELEGQIAVNVARKEREASHIAAGLVAEMQAAGELGRTA